MNQLAEENVQVLEQLIELVRGMSAAQYQQHVGLQGQQTIGKHVRHVVDHYESFLRHSPATGPILVNYETGGGKRRWKQYRRLPATACGSSATTCSSSLTPICRTPYRWSIPPIARPAA
jgi:hypothetical protein